MKCITPSFTYRKHWPRFLLDYYQSVKTAATHYNTLILSSIPKSGRYWLVNIFTNYLYIIYKNQTTPLTFTEIRNEIFPYRNEKCLTSWKPARLTSRGCIIKLAGYSNFIYGHTCFGLKKSIAKKVIFLYRNPLDQIVSRFYYSYKNRPQRKDWFNHPREKIDEILGEFIPHYVYMDNNRNENLLKLSYEQLKKHTVETVKSVLYWLDIEVDDNAVKKAIEFSSIKLMRKEEEKIGKAISFVRSGEVGGWKEYFNSKDVAYIKSKLAAYNIKLDSFTLE